MTLDAENDPKQIWQGQRKEKTLMSLDELRDKTRKRENHRRAVGMITLPFYLGMIGLFVFEDIHTYKANATLYWLGYLDPVFLTFIAVAGYQAFLALRMIRSSPLSANAGVQNSIQAYRTYFEWELWMARRAFGSLGVLLGAASVAAAGIWIHSAVFPLWDALEYAAAMALIGILCLYGLRRHRTRNLAELERLNSLEIDS